MQTVQADKLVVQVENALAAVGTLEWLVEQKPRVVIAERPDGLSRHAVLVTAEDEALARLILVWRNRGVTKMTYLGKDSPWQDTRIPWTEAAFAVLMELVEKIRPLMDEPEWMGKGWKVCIEPATELAGVLTQRQRTEIEARNAMYDHMLDQELYSRNGYAPAETLARRSSPDEEARQRERMQNMTIDEIPF